MTLPAVSIVLPCHRDEPTATACLESILTRTNYPDWEVILVLDPTPDPAMDRYATNPRVRTLRVPHGSVARAVNAGVAAAGERDVVRVHADVVVEDAHWLEVLAGSAQASPNAGVVGAVLVYPDGRIQAEGRSLVSGAGFHLRHRNRREYQPETFGPGKLLEVDGVPGALAYYRRDALRKVGGFDERYGRAWIEDDDFCVGARFHGYKVYVHTGVRGVHYTRCWAPSSQTLFPDAEGMLRQLSWQGRHAGELRQARAWESKWGWDPYHPDLHEIRRLYGHTEICWQIGEALRYRPANETPAVDCCLVTWNNLALLRRTLESLAQTRYPADRLRVYITDNASTDGTAAYLSSLAGSYPFPLHVETLAVNTGAPVGLNFAIVRGQGEFVARLDDDIVLSPDWLAPLVEDFSARPFAGCVGPKILNDDARKAIQCAAYRHFPGLFGHEDETDLGQADYLARTVHVRGCCNLYRRAAFRTCGLLDARFSPSQFDDPDHHIAMAVAGYEILYDGRVSIVHKLNNGLARSQAALSNQQGNALKMYGKWGGDIFEVLERAIDLSREGRYLPANGDVSALLTGAPKPSEFPRPANASAPPASGGGPELYEILARAHGNPELNGLAEDYLQAAAGQLRDGFPRHALDTLHAVANFAPHRSAVFLALAETYAQAGQPSMAQTMARRGLHLEPGHPRLAALAEGDESVVPTSSVVVGRAGQVGRPNDRSDLIGEAGVSVADARRAAGEKARLRVLMVNSFENRVAGGDMHQLKKTRQYLEELGVHVDVCCTPRPDPRGYDLVHLWNTWFPHQTLAQAKAVRALAPDIPIVLSTIYWDMREKAWADLAIPELFGGAASAAEVEQRLVALAEDRFLINGRRRSEAGEPNFRGYELYQRRLFELVDHLLPQSRAEVRNLQRTLGVSLPHTLIFNGAETSVFDRATPDWFVNQYKVRDFVLTVGLVEPRKNQLMLLHALRDTGLPVVVVGRNYDRRYLRLCRKHADKNALFIEHLPHEQLASAYRAARVHALPSWMECAAFVNVEAALSGCALAISDRTSEREYFGENAYYCDPAKIGSIREAVVKACKNHASDAPKRAALREQFRNRFTWPQAASQTLKGYEAALLARGRSLPEPSAVSRVVVHVPQDVPSGDRIRSECNPPLPARSPFHGPSPAGAPVPAQAPRACSEPVPVPVVTRAALVSAEPAEPTVSIIIPVLDRVDLTRRCLEQLQANTPGGWAEVIVVDNGSTDGTAEFLAAEKAAGRLVLVRNPRNHGFARACNQGACAATGRHLLFLNNDTEVQPGWLEPMIRLLEGDPRIAAVGSKLLYPDGTIQHAGVALGELPGRDPLLAVHTYHRAPADLPAANERRIYQALTAACLLVRRADFEAVLGFDEEFWNGYEDVDLCLRLQDRGGLMVYEPASVVVHHESQSGPARFEKAPENIQRLHRRWLQVVRLDARLGQDGQITSLPGGAIRPYAPLPGSVDPGTRELTSILILALNQLPLTRACLESIAAHTPEPHEIILVDNGSQDGTADYFTELAARESHITVVSNRGNRGFAAGNNQALARARGRQVVLLNNDTVVTQGWLGRMLDVLERHPETGLVGPRSNRVAGRQVVVAADYPTVQALPAFAREWAAAHEGRSQRVTRIVGFCLLARRDVIDRVGGLDERFGSGNFEDDDYCVRAQLAGFATRIADASFVHHEGSATFQGARIDYAQAMMVNWGLFKRKWGVPAETAPETGYRLPSRTPPGVSLRHPLPDLRLTHTSSADERVWTERTAGDATAPATVLPACAELGALASARSHAQAKDLPGAWEAACRAIQERPFHPEAWVLLAEIALAAGDSVTARHCAQRARDMAPGLRAAKQLLKGNLRGNRKHDWLRIPEAVERAGSAPRLTVCLITRNEEQFIEGCLASIRGLADQVVVVDTGSTDATVEIARRQGAEVHSFPWCDDFSAARNASLLHARGDWVLVLDADEELPLERHEVLRRHLRVPAAMGWRLPIEDAGRESEGVSYVPRLFRNAPGVHFVGRIHEQAFSSFELRRHAWGLESRLGEATLRHHGYTAELTRDRDKIARNLRLLEQALVEMPGETGLLMNYALELCRSGRNEEGVQQYRAAVEVMSAEPSSAVVPEAREMLLMQFTTQLMIARRHAEIIRLLTSPLARIQGGLCASLCFSLGLAHMELQQYPEALAALRDCIARRSRPALTRVNLEIHRAGPHHCLGLCLWQLGEPDKAFQAFALARQDDPSSLPTVLDEARFRQERGQPVEALQLLHAFTSAHPAAAAAWFAGGGIALSRRDFLEVALDWTTEAVRNHPDHGGLRTQHAEALLLTGDVADALPVWRGLAGQGAPAALAAVAVCLAALGEAVHPPAAEVSAAVTQEFVRWYRRLLDFGAEEVVRRLHEGAGHLSPAFPEVAEVLRSVMSEAVVA